MKKIMALLLVMMMSMSMLTACGGDNSSASGEGDVSQQDEVEVEEEEENKMDLSIYPSKNIESMNGAEPQLPTYDEMYARVESTIANTETEDDGTIYGHDANDNLVYMEDVDDDMWLFRIYDENGLMLEEYYYEGQGDTKPNQASVKDINGQAIYDVNGTGGGWQRITVYDYHANGNIAQEVQYDDGVLKADITYNENGDELVWMYYDEGVEKEKNVSTYGEDGQLQKTENYYKGELQQFTEYIYTSDDLLEKTNSYTIAEGITALGGYTEYIYYESGQMKTETEYAITGMGDYAVFVEGKEPTAEYYEVRNETEYYENGNEKIWTNYDASPIEKNGEYIDIDKEVTEYPEEYGVGDNAVYTAYDADGNVVVTEEYPY